MDANLGTASLGLAATLLAASAIGLLFAVHGLGRARDRVLRSDDIIAAADVLQRDLRMAETGQRGYLLVGDPRYLDAYEVGRTRVPQDLALLDQLVEAPAQKARLEALEPVVAAKLAELALTLRLEATSREAALTVVREGQGQSEMEIIDARLAVFADAAREILRGRTIREETLATRTAVAAAATALGAMLLGAAGVFLILRQQRLAAVEQDNLTLETRVAQRTEDLTRANAELDAFAYSISHDLRAPLRAIHGYAEILLEEAETLTGEFRAYLGRMLRAAEQMNQLIEDLLAYARLAKEEISVRAVSLDAVVARAADQVREACAASALEIRAPLGEALAHPPALQQVIVNLLSNACKYVEQDKTGEVAVWTRRSGGWVRLNVEDRGIGVAPEHRERIFEPFQRLHSVQSYAGTGIGLAIVRRAVERMGGRCGVESADGGGSRFWIELKTPEAP